MPNGSHGPNLKALAGALVVPACLGLLLGCAGTSSSPQAAQTSGGNGGTTSGTATVSVAVTASTATTTTGESVTVTASVSGATDTGVSWKVDGVANGSSAVGTISGSGNSVTYVAPATAGSHTVTATSTADSTATGSAAITVQAGSTGTGTGTGTGSGTGTGTGTTGTTTAVALSPATPTALVSGGSVTFTASATGSTGDTFTWSVDGVTGGNSTVGTVNGGVYTAPGSGSKALHTIKATSVSNASVSASVRVLTVTGTTLVNAKTQYGATGNGSTDDTSALQKAVSAAGSGICYVPAGTYVINPAATGNQFGLTIPSGATLLLDPAAVLKLKTFTGSGGYGGVLMNASNSAMVGGAIVGDRVARNLPTYIDDSGTDYEEGQGIQATSGASNLFIVGVTARDHCCDGFYFSGNVNNVMLSDCVADNNRRQGASLVYAHDITMQYSTFKNTNGNDPACGIDLEPNAGSAVTRVAIDHCTVFGNVGGGIAGGPAQKNGPTGNGSAVCSDSSVTNCTIYNNGGSNYQLGGLWWDESTNITFSNNTIYSNKSDGIWIAYYSRNFTITGNKVTGNQGNGIYLSDAAGTVVSGNTVTGNSSRQIYNSDGTATVGSNTTN
jgi:parallel beta-helix repeat protein